MQVPRSILRTGPTYVRGACPFAGTFRRPRRRCRHRHVLEPSAPFDDQLGLVYTDVTPTAPPRSWKSPQSCISRQASCTAGVPPMIESMASVSAYVWLAANGGGHVVGVNNNTDFPAPYRTAPSSERQNLCIAAGANSFGW